MYPFEQYASDIKSICAPLKQLHISGCQYTFITNDKRELRLGTHPHWMKHYYQQKLYQKSLFDKHAPACPDGFVLWSTLKSHQGVLSQARKFGLDHGITLMQTSKEGQEFFFFAGELDEGNMINQYLNHIDELKQFTAYFKERTRKIRQKSQHQLFYRGELANPTLDEIGDFEHLQVASASTRQSHSQLNHLTKRETMVAEQLLMGKSANQIAMALSISPRTVEKHIENMKVKLNCNNRTLLIKSLMLIS